MKKSFSIISLILCVALLLSAAVVSTAATGSKAAPSAAEQAIDASPAAGNDIRQGNTAAPDDSASEETRPTYKNYKFEDSFDGDLSKWQVVKEKEKNTDDFQIVADPDNAGNKVLHFTKNGSVLVPLKKYWPADGQMATVDFRLKFTGRGDGTNASSMLYAFKDYENYIASYLCFGFNGSEPGLWGRNSYMLNGDSTTQTGSPTVKPLHTLDWMQVHMTFSTSRITVSFTDVDENQVVLTANNDIKDAMFGIGFSSFNKYPYYMDDLSITFDKLSVDIDEEQKDIEVYYAGNTFYNPGDTLSIVGEDLYQTVKSVEIKKLLNTPIHANTAAYVAEQNYEFAVKGNTEWQQLAAVEGTERELEIKQCTAMDLKVEIPADGAYAEPGVYAVRLKAAYPGSPDVVLLINNPEIKLSIANDGDQATTHSGWLKLTGNNLSVQDDAEKVSALLIDAQGKRTLLDPAQIVVDTTASPDGRDNAYFVKIMLPALAAGEYSIMLHNGYGGERAWSAPCKFSVRAAEMYNSWRGNPETGVRWFDVTKYGAKGNAHNNDTAAVISALEAAYNAGGGTVYFPAGYYRVTDTLYVPENVTLMGYNKYHSCLFFDSQGWVDVPEYFILFENNFEINNIYIYGNIIRNILYMNDENSEGNARIYIHDVRINCDPTQPCSQGRGILMEGYTASTAQSYIKTQGDNYGGFTYLRTSDATKVCHIENSQFHFENTLTRNKTTAVSIKADYMYAEQFAWQQWSSVEPFVSGLFENCEWERGCLNYAGNCAFMNCKAANCVTNNRELLCTDGHPKANNESVQDLNTIGLQGNTTVEELLEAELAPLSAAERQKRIAEVTAYINANRGRVFRFYSSKQSYGNTATTLYISAGQGAGQIRKLADVRNIGNYTYFTVANAFAVNPNRNSKVSLYCYRGKVFVVNCDFSNGWRVGTYGTMVDAVFDGIKFSEEGSGITLHTNQGQIWYITAKNTVADGIITGHTTEVVVKPSGCWNTSASATALSYFGIQFRNNHVGEGGYYTIASTAYTNGTCNILFENNTFVSTMGAGIASIPAPGAQVDGIYLKGNKQYTDANDPATRISAYDSSVLSIAQRRVTNKFGSLRIYCDETEQNLVTARALGDINNDGIVSLKDITLLRFYLVEQISFDKDQMKYADYTKDGEIDSLDVLAIRAYLLGKPFVPPGSGDVLGDGEGFFEGNF